MLPDSSVLNVAQAVADGSAVDWDAAESSAQSEAERHVLRQLRHLAELRAAASPAPEHRWGPLQVHAEVGRGSFGTVYRAWDTRLEREVALKLLRQEAADGPLASRILSEGRLLARIRDRGVVTVYGADTFEGRAGIWMEFVTGRTLKDILEQQGPFGPHEAALLGRDICRALAAVHGAGILHRDIKAQNVIREAGGRTVLMDFGAGFATRTGLSAAGLAGTPAYLAPEVLAGGAASASSDLYSLGVLLYHLVSGQFPVTGRSLDEIREQHAQRRRRLLRDARPDLPPSFVRLIDRATAIDPAERPQTAGAMEQLLEEALRDTGARSGPAPAASSAAPSRGLVAWARAHVVGLTVAALGIAGAIAWAGRGTTPPAATTPAEVRSVAVLPFRNLTAAGTDDAYLADGISDDLGAHLAALRDLRVISGSSMRRYKDRTKTEIEIGRELGVATVLDSSLRRSGDRARIVSRLIDVRTGEQLWSESFERDVRDLMTMQSEVARKIAVALKGELSQLEESRLARGAGEDFETASLYMRGRYSWGLRTEEAITKSIEYYNEAIARNPRYAPAYAGLADAYTSLGTYGYLPRAGAFTRAADAAERAVALDGSLAEAHVSLAYAQKARFDWAAAERSFKRAIELKPGNATAHHFYSIFLTQHGRFGEALAEAKAAGSLDPLSVGPQLQLASVLAMARRYDDAVAQYEHALSMDPSLVVAYRSLAEIHAWRGAFAQAFAAADKATRARSVSADDQELKAVTGYLLARTGRAGEALEIVRSFETRFRQADEDVAVGIAAVYAGLNRRDEAIDWLSKAVDRRDSEVGYLKVDPRWDTLRDDARFGALVRRLGLTP